MKFRTGDLVCVGDCDTTYRIKDVITSTGQAACAKLHGVLGTVPLTQLRMPRRHQHQSQPRARKPYGNRLRLCEEGRVEIIGVDYSTNDIHVVAMHATAIVLKVAGRMGWNGRSEPRKYNPPEMLVYRIIEQDGNMLVVEPLICWDAGRKGTKT